MPTINILNKIGLLTSEDRKEPLVHGCEHFTFETCLDLSKPIKIIPYGNRTEFTLNEYSQDVSSFICWWSHFVKDHLNGFSGFSNIKFEPIGFKIIND